MNIFDLIKTNYNKNSKNEKKIADFILNFPKKVLDFNLKDFSKEIEVGEATILRFTNKNFQCGYTQFKLLLSASLQEKRKSTEDFILDKNITSEDSILNISKKINYMSNTLLSTTIQNLDFNSIEKAKDMMLKANRIIFVGTGFSNLSAKNSCYKFMRIGLNCFNFSDPEVAESFIKLFDKNDLVIGFSQSGINLQTKSILKIAKDLDLNIIGITANSSKEFASLCTLVLEHTECENELQGGSFLGSLSQMFITELLYTLIVLSKEEKAIETKKKTLL